MAKFCSQPADGAWWTATFKIVSEQSLCQNLRSVSVRILLLVTHLPVEPGPLSLVPLSGPHRPLETRGCACALPLGPTPACFCHLPTTWLQQFRV